MTRMTRTLLIGLLLWTPALVTAAPGDTASFSAIHTIFIEKMPNELDQCIRAEITKQLTGRLVVVLDKGEADAIMRGASEERTGTGAQVTGRYLGLHDTANGSISVVDKDEKVVLWSAEAGDRSLLFNVWRRGGVRKVAVRLVSDLKQALEKVR